MCVCWGGDQTLYCHVVVTLFSVVGTTTLSLSTTTTTVSTLEWIEFTQISYMKSFDDKLTRVQNIWGVDWRFNNKWGLIFFVNILYVC